MEVRRPPPGERREHDAQDRPSEPPPIHLHQPVALVPGRGPEGLLGGQGQNIIPHMASSIGQPLPHPGFPPVQQQQQQQQPHPQNASMMQGQPQAMLPAIKPAQVPSINTTQQPILHDALSYLDQVKIQFQAQPDVYNKFLDIMKEFKSGSIDTPGVIDRVSQLFAGHPNLIQGFNTFLPPGYKIECGMGDDPNSIRVTTPMGTTNSVLPARPTSTRPLLNQNSLQPPPHFAESGNPAWPPPPISGPEHGFTQDGRLPPQGPYAHGGAPLPPAPSLKAAEAHRELTAANVGQLDQRSLPPLQQGSQGPIRNPTQMQVAAAEAMVSAPNANGASAQMLAASGAEKRGPVEFNHAINYVNKIKNRFASQPDIYKQFLEILQTYQRESKPIGDVYTQVTRLFESAPDLLEDFKQFLPESAAHANAVAAARAGEAQFPISSTRTDPTYQALANQANLQHTPRAEPSRLPPMGNFAPTPSSSRDKRKRGEKAAPSVGADPAILAAGRGILAAGHVSKKQKITSKPTAVVEVDPLTTTPSLVPAMPPPLQVPSTAATADDLQMFEKIRKDMANKTQFSEFIKLLNLFNQDLITGSYCLYRAKQFIDPKNQTFAWLKALLGNPSEEGAIRNNPRNGAGNTRVSLSKCRSMGPSYRLLPKYEQNQLCSGRDELCRSVLNDEWVSHPTWESEEAGFVAHKKTQWEEALHRIEEERHDYDTNIEALSRTIQLLEPYVLSIDASREVQIDSKLGGQSEFIYKRAIYKAYGRETGHVVIERLFTVPNVVIPALYSRLKDVREKWKAGQRQWNEVWRQQMQANYDKSLDPQGSGPRGTADKRQFQAKTLHNEARAKKDGKIKARMSNMALNLNISPARSDYQFAYEFTNEQVLSDTLRLILAQIQAKSEDAILIARTEEFFNVFLGKEGETTADVDMNDDDTPAQSIEVQPRAKTRKSKPLSRAVFGKGRGNGSGSGSRGNTPVADSAVEDEAVDTAAATEQDAATPVQRNWFNPSVSQPPDGVSRPVSIAPTPREDVSMADSVEKEGLSTEESERKEYHMYCNGNLYCFMRLFGTLYERLCLIFEAEQSVKDTVESQLVRKPAHELGWITKRPSDYFDLDAVKAGTSFYQQVVDRFLRYIQLPTEAASLQDIEDMLRQYYLFCGYKLYHFDRLLQQMDRLAAVMFSNEKDKATEQLIQLFKKDRAKKFATVQDEMLYRKQAAKYLGPKDKADDPAYRITYIEQPVKSMFIQLIDKEESVVPALTDEEKWHLYVLAYAQDAPTEGVEINERLAVMSRRWPFLRQQIRDSSDPEVCVKEKLSLQIHSISYKITILSNSYDAIEVTELNLKNKGLVRKLRKSRKNKFIKAYKDESKKVDNEIEVETEADVANTVEKTAEGDDVVMEDTNGKIESEENPQTLEEAVEKVGEEVEDTKPEEVGETDETDVAPNDLETVEGVEEKIESLKE